jgi:putative ABC transport system permease protein
MSGQSEFRFPHLVAQNLRNRPFRSFATIFAFAIIASTFFSSQFLMSGAKQSLDAGISRMGADILVVPTAYAHAGQSVILTGEPTTFFLDGSSVGKVSSIAGVAKASSQIYIATLHASCCAAPVQMIAIDPERDFTVSSWLKENPGITLGKDDMIIGSAVVQETGKELVFFGHTYYVVGQLQQTGMGVDNSVFVRADDARVMADESGKKAVQKLTIPDGMISLVLVKLDPSASPATVAVEIERQVPGAKTILPNGLLNAVSGQLSAVMRLLYGSTIAVTIITVPLLGLLTAMMLHERRREISILRVLGARTSFIAGLMLAESFVLAIIGGLIGIGVAIGIMASYQDLIALMLKIPFLIPSPLVILAQGGDALLLMIGIAGASSVYPIYRITRSEPYETIRKGES